MRIEKDMGSPPTEKPYRSLIGSPMYGATLTRPDIVTIAPQLSGVLDCPQETHWKAGTRVLRYLYLTKDRWLNYDTENNMTKHGWKITWSVFSITMDTTRNRISRQTHRIHRQYMEFRRKEQIKNWICLFVQCVYNIMEKYSSTNYCKQNTSQSTKENHN